MKRDIDHFIYSSYWDFYHNYENVKYTVINGTDTIFFVLLVFSYFLNSKFKYLKVPPTLN